MAKNGLARLDVSNVFKLAQQVESDVLPRLVAAMNARIDNPETSAKELVGIFRALSGFARTNQRLDEELGITRRGGSSGNVFNIITKNVSIEELRGMTEDAREQLLLSALDGDEGRVLEIIADKVTDE